MPYRTYSANPTSINTQTQGYQSPPKLVTLEDGRSLYVWSDNAIYDDVSTMDLQARIFDADGTPSTGQISLDSFPAIDGFDGFDWDNLSVNVLDGGNVMISYVRNTIEDAGRDAPVFGILEPTDTGLNIVRPVSEIASSDDTVFESPPVTTVLDNGNVLFVWSENAASDDLQSMELQGRIYDPETGSFTSGDFTIGNLAVDGSNTADWDNMQVTQLEGGNVVVSYAQSNVESGFTQPVFTVLNEDGGVVLANQRIEGTDDETQHSPWESPPVVTALEDGNFMAVWTTDGFLDDRPTQSIEGRIFDGDGAPVTGDFSIGSGRVDGFDGYDNDSMTVTNLGNGTVVVGYVENSVTSGDASNLPHFSIVDASTGATLVADVGIAANPGFGAGAGWQGPAVIEALGDSGNFVAVFGEGNAASGGGYGLNYRVFDETGQPLTGDIELTAGGLNQEAVSGLNQFDWDNVNVEYNEVAGTFTVGWVGVNDGSATGVFSSGPIDVSELTGDGGGLGSAGPVDGLETGEVMDPGYTDAQGDIIDGADGITDTIIGNGGDDTIDGGAGADLIYGDDTSTVVDGGGSGGGFGTGQALLGSTANQINSFETGYQSPPIVTAMDNGQTAYVWTNDAISDDTPNMTLQIRIFNADGSAASEQIDLDQLWAVDGFDGYDWDNMSVDQLPDGNLMLSYVRNSIEVVNGAGNDEPVFSIIDPSALGTQQQYVVTNQEIQSNDTTVYESPPLTTVLDNGDVLFVWSKNGASDDTPTMDLYGRTYDTGTNTWNSSEYQISSIAVDGTNSADVENLSVEQLEGGNIVVSWAQSNIETTSTPFTQPVYQMLDESGTPTGSTQAIQSSDTTAYESPAKIVALDDGNWMAVWTDNGYSDDTPTMQLDGRIFDANGTAVTSDFQISQDAVDGFDGYDVENFTAETLGNGNVVVGFVESSVTGGSDNSPQFTILDANGAIVAQDIEIAQNSAHPWPGPPVIEALGDSGAFVAVYGEGNAASGGAYGLNYRVFDADGMPLTNEIELQENNVLDGESVSGLNPFDWDNIDVAYNEASNTFSVGWVGQNDGSLTGVYSSGPIAGVGGVNLGGGGTGTGGDTALGGADVIEGGLGADVMFGERGDDTFVVGSAAEGAGDVIDGGNGPDQTTDLDTLDLRGAGAVTIDDAADANDVGATAGTVTFADGSTLDFEGIETIETDLQADGVVDGAEAAEVMAPGYVDLQGDEIDGADGLDDTIFGNEGDDTIDAGLGNDFVEGGLNDDLIDGNAGNDTLFGNDGNDTLDGGEGSDELDGGLNDDDIVVGAGDSGFGGAGDDVFTVDPTVSGTDGITIAGGELDEETIIDPTNNPDGQIGDVLDLTGLGPVEIAYDETDPTFNPETGVSESGTATYINDDGLPVVINFSEIENVLSDAPVDVAPVANPDTADVDEDTPIIIDVLANDTDPDTPVEALEVTAATAPNGTVEINDDGTLSYTPDPEYSGADEITYTVSDPEGNTAVGTVTLDVAPVNDAPVANDDAATTDEVTPVTIDVLANDEDEDNAPDDLAVTGATAPNGTVTINDDSSLEYTPDEGFVGVDTITYVVSDPSGATDTATVAVTVDAIPDEAPVANPDTATVEEGAVVTIDVLANDTDPDTPVEDLDVTDADAPNGIVDINDDGTLSYEPDAGFVGTDTITYTVTDPDGNSATSTVTVTVTEEPGGDAPVAQADVYDIDLDGYEGGNVRLGSGDEGLLGNDTDPNDDPLRVSEIDGSANLRTWVDGDNGGQIRVTSSGAVRFRDDEGDFADLPDGEVVQTTVSYTVSDGNGGFDTATVTVNVTGAAVVDDLSPDAVDDVASATAGDVTVIDVLANDTDADTPVDQLEVIDAEAENGIIDINDDGTLSYEPDAGFTGTDTITYTITDPEGNTDTAIVTVTVSEGEVTPVANPDSADVDEDTTIIIDVLANDTDPDTPVEDLEVTEATATNGTVEINDDGTLSYTPDPDYSGPDEITYTVSDPDGNTAVGTVTVAVDPVNDAPVAQPDTAQTDEDTSVVIDVLANDSDEDNTPEELEVTAATAPNGTVEINDDGTLEYTPDDGFFGEDEITYTITDPSGATSSATVGVSVAVVAVDPVANPDDAATAEDTPVTIDVLANDTDPDTPVEELDVTEATAPNGSVQINADGTLEYTPNPDYFGQDEITYTVSDPDGNTAVGTVTVAVDPVNDAPVANPDDAVTEEDTAVTIDVLANDEDEDNAPDDLEVIEATAPNGSVLINADGTLEYTPDTGFFGEDTITYTIADPSGATSTSTVSVTVDEVIDGGGDGVVDGAEDSEVMDPGYDDGEGDQVDGADGIDDVIEGNGGNDTIDGGLGNDVIDGGDGDDVIQGGEGNDTIEGSQGFDDILGGGGGDTYQGDDAGHVVVYVDDAGNGEVTNYPTQEIDSVNSVEHFSGAEVEGELDKISFTTAVGSNSIEEDIEGLDDTATGYFFPTEGDFVNFGPDNDYTLSDLFSGTSPDGALPAVGPAGEYFVSDGTEAGQVGQISFENFEQIFFTIEEEPEAEEDIMALLSNGETLDETMPIEEDLDEEDLSLMSL